MHISIYGFTVRKTTPNHQIVTNVEQKVCTNFLGRCGDYWDSAGASVRGQRRRTRIGFHNE